MTAKPPPWRRPHPPGPRTKLTDEQIARARQRAERAGRRYPNLVDNLAVLAADRRSKKQR